MSDVKTPSSDSIVLHPPAEASSAMLARCFGLPVGGDREGD